MSSATADEVVDVVLRDGGTLRLRSPLPGDKADLLEFFAGLSDRSRYLRFHGVRHVDDALVAPFIDDTDSNVGALIGILGGRIVALASYAHIPGGESAEMAFAVADSEQRRGIGTRLLEQLAQRARRDGIVQFIAEVMSDNRQALGVFADAGFEIVREFEHGEVELRFPVEPTQSLRSQIEGRDHTAVVASLRAFFEPKTVAVVGASRRRGSIGGELFRNILEADFAGAVHPVNRNGDPVAGVRGYSTVAAIAEAVDLAVICVPGDQVSRGRSRRARRRNSRSVRDLVRIRRDGRRRRGATAPATRARTLARRASDRTELPRHRVHRDRPQRNLCAARPPRRDDRLLVTERRAWPRAPRTGVGSPAGVLVVRLDRQQGRRLLERLARVVGGR